jgi:hypothetical protein
MTDEVASAFPGRLARLGSLDLTPAFSTSLSTICSSTRWQTPASRRAGIQCLRSRSIRWSSHSPAACVDTRRAPCSDGTQEVIEIAAGARARRPDRYRERRR